MSSTSDRLLDNSEAAAMLSCSPATLVKMREAGTIPFVRLQDTRKGYRYSLKALEKLIAERQQRNELQRSVTRITK
jgi:predicted site-specific integrase-resolvase